MSAKEKQIWTYFLSRRKCMCVNTYFLILIIVTVCGVFVAFSKQGHMINAHSTNDVRDTWARLSGPLHQDNLLLLDILKNYFLEPPSTLPYNFSKQGRGAGSYFSYPWIYRHLSNIFDREYQGFFVEAGALDGEYLSNTLWLEQEHHWNGLLIEPDIVNYRSLLKKHRRAWTSNTCISPEPYPKKTIFVTHYSDNWRNVFEWAYRGNSHEMGIDISNGVLDSRLQKSYSEVQCFPLISYLLALNVSKVDLLSLDIQGGEGDVLKSILSTNKINVRVIVAEDEKRMIDMEFMKNMGYKLIASSLDHIFIKDNDPLLKTLTLNSTEIK